LTGSVGLLSDALESLINLLAAVTAYFSLWYSSRPIDASHTYGHEKIEYFSSGLEGMLIIVAGLGIIVTAVQRLIYPQPLESLGLGGAIAIAASLVNFIVARLLIRGGRAHQSIILEADGQHLMSDVLTSVAVVGGLGIVWLTGWTVLDPIIAILVALNIGLTGYQLIRRSFNGLMDHSIPEEEQEKLRSAVRKQLEAGMMFHALRTRQAGARRFADFHMLVPGALSVRTAHDLAERIEASLRELFPNLEVTIHIEPIEALESWGDNALEGIEPPNAKRE
ncbi:MAG: cation diffusion facilitator family transporter, partial [Planctomycetes bacterium]|nr:cation diffusion facilitator family transporter [Planctomycetota bacterium]